MSLAEKPVLTLGETAELLSVTERTIQTYIKRGKLRALDLGGAVRILNPLIEQGAASSAPTNGTGDEEAA